MYVSKFALMDDFRKDLPINRSPLFQFLIYYMDEELYYHRIFLTPRREIELPRTDDPIVQYGPLAIFVQEAIHFTLTELFDIEAWPMPFDMVELRRDFPDKIYFNTIFGRAMCHYCTVCDSLTFAMEGGYKVTEWLKQAPFEAMEFTAKFLEIVRKRTRPVNIAIIYMLAFAGHLVFHAVKANKPELVDAACRSCVYMFHRAFPYEWIYWNSRLWALTYNTVHNDLHETWIPGGMRNNLV